MANWNQPLKENTITPKKRFCDCIGVVKMNDGKIVIADGRHGTNRLIVFQVDI